MKMSIRNSLKVPQEGLASLLRVPALALTFTAAVLLLTAWGVDARPQESELSRISSSIDPLITTSQPDEQRQLELDRFKTAILNELGLDSYAIEGASMESQAKTNISAAEYARAYAEYMSVVHRRRQRERYSGYVGPQERRRDAVRVIQAFENIGTDQNLTKVFTEDGQEEYRQQLLFNVHIANEPKSRLRRAVLEHLPKGCHVPEHTPNSQRNGDITDSLLRFLAEERRKFNPDRPYGVTVICRSKELVAIPMSLSVVHQPFTDPSHRRKKRSANGGPISLQNYEKHNSRSRDCDKTRHGKTCCRKPMKVSFEELKIKDLILEPKEFNANMCSGRCNARRVPYASTHAMFQHTLHQNKGKKEIPRPCCTPTKLSDLDVLHTVPGTNILQVTILSNAIVEECSCS